jgi:predicted transposase/invertase (TIGR01784 family)
MIKERYINLFTDFGFKRVFGQEANKDLLIDFLNQVLPPEYLIKTLSFSKNEHSNWSEEDRKAIFDLHCISAKGERFIIELQKAKQQFFKDRALYYTAFPITEQAVVGEWDYQLRPIFLIAILNFAFDDSDKEQLRHHVMLRDQNCKVFYDKLHFIYLEVVKFDKTLQECTSRFEKWLWIFKNLPDLKEVPSELMNDMLSKVFKIAEVSKFNKQEQKAYLQSLKYLRDLHNVVDTAFEEGKVEGEQIGLEKGIKQTACKLLQQGVLSLAQISEITGLSVETLEQLDCSEF